MHHANLIIGSRAFGYETIGKEDTTPGPDVTLYEEALFSIDDARKLREEAVLRPSVREYRTFILSPETLLPPAQNALLKLFEDPQPQTVFYLIVRREDILLPTLRSRLNLLAHEEMKAGGDDFKKFRACSYAERLALIGEKLKAEDDNWVTNIFTGFEEYAEKEKNASLIEEAIFLAECRGGGGNSKKMLLEHLALSF